MHGEMNVGTSATKIYDSLTLAIRPKSLMALHFKKFSNEKAKLSINSFGKYVVNTYYVQIFG